MMKIEVNLKPLMHKQEELDEHILETQKLKRAPFLDRILAFVVELGECANEWKQFKFWKVEHKRISEREAMLEEYVDMLHFILSVGNDAGIKQNKLIIDPEAWQSESVTRQFLNLADHMIQFGAFKDEMNWQVSFRILFTLGYMLGFTWEQIEDAYWQKNQVNHKRQVDGY